ncbi:MAG: N-6 DNA methylase [Bryobacteraceae bacterium]
MLGGGRTNMLEANAPKEVVDLVERFERNLEAYRSEAYNETRLRREFIDPFFGALGWDIDNRSGAAEAYKDVIHEDSIKIGGATKAPDYCFRIGGTRKFFVEAKKPAVNVKQESASAFQLRRYAWSSKLPLSILTNFREFAAYDCRIRPDQHDAAATARILCLPFTDYVSRWAELAGVFSKEAVYKGFFDRHVEVTRGKRGTAEVDSAFLGEIESWREVLARNFALRNPDLGSRDTNFVVQRLIDRIIFLRICEDRGIEPYERLRGLASQDGVYRRLCVVFKEADERYNSGLFHFYPDPERQEAPDAVTLNLDVDDRVLTEIIRNLYYPDSPYEFSVLPADILGQVYEQFLGKVIRLTAGHQAKIEDKPEVKKAGGVYYTPTYVVDFIVDETVGKLLEGRSVKEASKVKILDPACGSGSFLLGAYQYLLDWHRRQYEKDGPEKHKKVLYRGPSGGWRLTASERRRILLNSIFGVDIDNQAVEVTKLSLLLKVLEGETGQSLTAQLRMFHERALPDLGSNIKCGNSLVGSDYQLGRQMGFLDEDEMYRINAFDWGGEDGFPDIVGGGGFDAVIGNPPYVRQESLAEVKDYMQTHFKSYQSTADLYVYFMEKALRLLRAGGSFSFIVSSSFLKTAYADRLREFMTQNAAVIRIVDFGGLSLFAKAKDVYVSIPVLQKTAQPDRVSVCQVESVDHVDLRTYVPKHEYDIQAGRLVREGWPLGPERTRAVFEKIVAAGVPLEKYVGGGIFRGLLTGLNEAFEIDGAARKRMIREVRACADLIKPFLGGQDIRRYSTRDTGRFLIVIPSGWTRGQMGRAAASEREAWNWLKKEYSPVACHLEPFADAARKRQDKGDFWWELRACDYYDVLDGAKIVYPDIAKGPRFFLDTAGTYIANTAYCLGSDDPYLLGILNSKLFWFAIGKLSIPFGTRAGEFRYRLIYQYMANVPIRQIDANDSDDRRIHDHLVTLVQRMLALSKQLAEAKSPPAKTPIERQIHATDAEIDRLVFELYGLNEEEMRIAGGETTQ